MSLLPTLAFAFALATAMPFPPDPVLRSDHFAAADELEGLWKAKRRFGPDARGPLVIRRAGTSYTADMMGRLLPVRAEGDELSFELPRGEGAFRGMLQDDGTIRGAWMSPRSPAMGGRASPVVLTSDGAGRWSGEVVPFEDTFTFYLLVEERPDGSLGALLRNPERDFGALLGVERLVRDGALVRLFGKGRGETEEREIVRGSYDAESDVLSLVFSMRGGTYDFHREDDQSDFYPRGLHPQPYAYQPPLARDDGWTPGTLEEAGIDRAAAERFVQVLLDMPMDSLGVPLIHGLLIARHGKLVLEEYFHGEHRDRLHETRSAAKSVTATLVGAVIQAGEPLEVSTPVYQVMNDGAFPAELEPRKRAMTLEHLLTMSSGYYCDDSDPEAPGREDGMWDRDEPDFVGYTLAVPMAFAPGDTAIYCSANPNLALGMVARATGEFPLYLFDRLLARPMRIDRYGWITDPGGNLYGGGGVHFLPRDFLKFGQLMLDDGTWQGRRILSSSFVERASSPLYRMGERGYGYLWWRADMPYGQGTVSTFSALGAGGQNLTVVPALDLVIAVFGGNYSSRGWQYMQAEFIPGHLLPAVR
ncbi:MAG TPA: serine hydrolase [Gemmatimonadota bacterium]|nr:serine hydrolase [Gemmatimonadota bacterium]